MKGPRRTRFKSDRLVLLHGHSNSVARISVDDFVSIGKLLNVKQKILVSHEMICNW